MLEKVQTFCLQLPQVSERLSHGAPSFFVGRKICFVMCQENHHAVGFPALWCACNTEFRDLLVANSPTFYFVPPYVGYLGWLGVRLDQGLDWETIETHLRDAHTIKFKPPRASSRKSQ